MGAGMTTFPTQAFAARFAPVERAEVHRMDGNRVCGIATPVDGPRPCAVILAAGDRIFGVAIAGSFSPKAESAGVRDGWCGFEVTGIQHAMALGLVGQLRCAVTGRVLVVIDDDDVAQAANAARIDMSVEALRISVGKQNGTADIEAIWPFANALIRERGIDTFLDEAYRYLLGRPIDSDGWSSNKAQIAAGVPARRIWDGIVASDEFKSRSSRSFPGPFAPEFSLRVRAFGLGMSSPT